MRTFSAYVAGTDGPKPRRPSNAVRTTLVASVLAMLASLVAGGCARRTGTGSSSSARKDVASSPSNSIATNRPTEPVPHADTPPGKSSVTRCTASSAWSLRIRVQDASTGASICDASLVASLGTVHEQLKCFGRYDCRCVGFSEQQGTFQVTVTKPGYRTVTKTVVVDQSTGCHVVTKDATVRMRRLGNTPPVR
jgi:hypothetical protein